MYETLFFIAILFTFLYLKDKIDQLRSEVDILRAKLGMGGSSETVNEPVAAANEEVIPEQRPEEVPPLQEFQDASVAAFIQKTETVSETEKSTDENLEFKIGSKVFTGVGVVAVICAVGFFLRYAFEVDLINGFGRVVLGVLAGIALLAVGELKRKNFPIYGQMLTGGGLGVLYLSFYAAFNYYDLMTQPTAFFAMIIITAAGILLSLRQNSMALAMFAQIGGFLTPLLINSGEGNLHVLFLYVILLDIAVFLTAFYKLWQPLSVAGFIGTALTYLYWYFNFYDSLKLTPALAYLSVFFVIFLCIPFIQYFVKKSPENSWDLSLISFNPMFYFAMSYAIINPLYPDLMGWFTVTLGALYCALAVIVGGEDERASLLRHFLLTTGCVLLAIAVPILFDGKWIVAAWAAESLAFVVTGFKLKSNIYRILGNLLLFLSMFKLFFFESGFPGQVMFLLNDRFLSYAVCFGAAAGAAYIYRHRKNELSESEAPVFSLLLLAAAFAAIAGPSFDIYDFVSNHGKWTVVLWAAEALLFVVAGFKFKLPLYRGIGHCLFLMTLIRLVLFEGDLWTGAMPIFNLRLLAYVAFFAAAVASAYLYRRNKSGLGSDERALFSILALEGAFCGLAGLSFEIHDFYDGYWYPILWTVGGLAAGLLSYRLKNTALRCVTYITFAASFFRLLGFDSHVNIATYLPIFNTRVFAFAVSAVFVRLFLSMFRANKDKMSADEYQIFQPALFMLFHFLALWVISIEIIGYCDKQILLASSMPVFDFGNIKNVMLSAAWTVYGVGLMAAGIIKKTLYERFLAIALFAIVIVKVFLFDTAELGNLYRFFSFIILGCFLLLVGYLYYRYQSRIRKFVKAE